MALDYIQSNTLYQTGSGSIVGATTVTTTTFTDIYGNILTMASFGAKGYGTAEPDTTNEEGFTWTGVIANVNGTYTLTGVSTILAQSPYTETSGLVRSHAGGTKIVITDNVAFWNTFGNKQNDEALVGRWTTPVAPLNPNDIVNKTYADGLAIAGSPNASTTVKGIGEVSVAPVSPTTPIFVGDNDPRVPTQGENNALVGNNTDIAVGTGNKFVTQTGLIHNAEKYAADGQASDTYVITLSPIPTSYTTGMVVYFKANTANTGAATINVNSLGAKTIVKYLNTALADNDIVAGMFCTLIYDGTNFVLQNPIANLPNTLYTSGTTTKNASDASTTQNIAHGLRKIPKYIRLNCTSWGFSTGNTNYFFANTVYNGTTQSSQSAYGNGSTSISNDNTFTLNTSLFSGNTQVGVVTFDSTNIIITWTKTVTPTGTYQILWEAQG